MRSRDERSFITFVRRALSPSVSGFARSASRRSYRRSTSSSLSIICRGSLYLARPLAATLGGPARTAQPSRSPLSGRAHRGCPCPEGPLEERHGVSEELLGVVLVGEQPGAGNLHQLRRTGELRQHRPCLCHREERVV